MSIHEPLVPEVLDPGADAFRLRTAVGGFLAGYGTSTGEAYALDLRQWAAWRSTSAALRAPAGVPGRM